MKKRILTVLLSAAIAVSALCGCEESRETGGRARTKEEQREESTREDSRENSEDSGETSAEESRVTSAVENGETSSEESTDLLTGALGGGEDSIELSVNFTDPNFEAGYSDFIDLKNKDFGEIWSSDDNYVKSYIAEDGTEYSLDMVFPNSGIADHPCGAVVQGMPVAGYPDVFYTVWDFSDESGAIDYDTINEYNLVYAYNAGYVHDSNSEYTPDCLEAKYGIIPDISGTLHNDFYNNIKSQILKTKKCHMRTVVNDIEKYCDLLYDERDRLFKSLYLMDNVFVWFNTNRIINQKEVFHNIVIQVINDNKLEDLSYPVIYTFVDDYVLNNKVRCHVETLELPNAENAYTAEFLGIFNTVYPGESPANVYSYSLNDGGSIFISDYKLHDAEDSYRRDKKLREAGLTDDTPIFKEGLPTE